MIKNSILAVLVIGLSGCSSFPPTVIELDKASSSNFVRVDVSGLGQLVNVGVERPTTAYSIYPYIVTDSWGQYVSSHVKSQNALTVKLLSMNVEAYEGMSDHIVDCKMVYSVNDKAIIGNYHYELPIDSIRYSREALGTRLITPCLDRLSHDITVHADSL